MTNQIPVIPKPLIKRQCGTRHSGGVYITTNELKDIETLAQFMIDSPFSTEGLNLSSVGMNLIQRPGTDIYDVYDVIGQDSYPFVWDFIEETIQLGISRKIPKNLMAKITPGESMHIMVHAKALAKSGDDYMHEFCPTHQEFHTDPDVDCLARAKWCQQPTKGDIPGTDREYTRRLECGREYKAGVAPAGTEYEQAAFLWMPITRFEVIEDTQNQTHNDAVNSLMTMGFNFDLVDN